MKQQVKGNAPKKIGRPRSFDEYRALDKAMLAFWRHGYESTSMSLLTKEMGMNPPSIYAAFGDKKELFLKALNLYVGDLEALKSFVDKSPSAFEAAHEMLKGAAIRFTGDQTPRGCLLASAAASGLAESADVPAAAAKIRAQIQGILRRRIERDIELKLLPKTTSSSSLATFIIAIIQGLSVLARDGATRKKLLVVAELAMAAWP